MSKVAIYIRLSKEDEHKINKENDSESIINQKNMLVSYAYEKKWEIYKIYSDEDYSGSDIARPAFNEMLKDAETGKFQILLCKSLSRFARDVATVETYIHDRFIEWGIRFIAPADYADSGQKGSRKNIQINSLVNQWYLEDMSENIKSVLRHKKQQGQYLSAVPPYGYKKDPENKYRLVKDENVQCVVEKIFEMALSEHSLSSILRYLNNSYICPPTVYRKTGQVTYEGNIKHTQWGNSSLSQLLNNPIYAGNLVLNVWGTKTYKSKYSTKKPKEEWIIHENMQESYVGLIEFEKIRSIRKNRNSFITNKNNKLPNPYKGLIYCGVCGGKLTLTVENSKAKGLYYRCMAPIEGRSDCKGVRISQKWISEILTSEIKRLINEYLEYGANYSLDKSDKKDTLKSIKAEIQSLRTQLHSLQTGLSESFLEKVDEKISQEEYDIIRNSLMNRISGIKDAIKDKENRILNIKQAQEESKNMESFINENKDFDVLSREIIISFISRIVVNERNSKKKFDYNVVFEYKV
ncbi:MAG: recombinase family protein [Oscillospiraceae bacterium]|nr:recombinase family protein [Oscillospiraceae bacterium]